MPDGVVLRAEGCGTLGWASGGCLAACEVRGISHHGGCGCVGGVSGRVGHRDEGPGRACGRL